MVIAEELAKKQRAISIAQFFEKNKQILGFDSLQKSLIMAVKESVDNSLDACEEAEILPEIEVVLKNVGKDEYYLSVEDNGPGIIRKEIPKIFGQFLYGSKFFSMQQARGQQGIGISAVVLYSQITSGKPISITSKTKESDVAYQVKMFIDTKENRAATVSEDVIIVSKEHGLKIEFYMKGKYVKGKQSIIEYLKNSAIVNPYAKIKFTDPDGSVIIFDRVTNKIPAPPKETKPHPMGLEIGDILELAKNTKHKTLTSFLSGEFSKVSNKIAVEICTMTKLDPSMDPSTLKLVDAKNILESFKQTKLLPPSSESLSPIGENLIKKGLKNVLGAYKPSFYAIPVSRKPAIYHGNVFIVEAGMVYGGDLPKEEQISIMRFANKVPLLYQAGACAITKAVSDMDWRKYGFEQKSGAGIPSGPAIVLVHVASTKVPFTSESKEAIAEVPEIIDEIKLALRDLARQIRTFLTKKEIKAKLSEKFFLVQKILPQIALKSANILNKPVPKLEPIITQIMNVVWIDEDIEESKDTVKVTVRVSNFTADEKKFTLYADLPEGKVLEGSADRDCKIDPENDSIEWEISIKSLEQKILKFTLTNIMAGTYKESTYYVEGINPVYVVGAEPLPGDWNIEDLKAIIADDSEMEEDENDEL
ncbi:MAG: DNA topoisomerase VI subunit B [Thermoplasmata archaeon]